MLFVSIPYVIARQIEKYFWKHASPELKKELHKKLKDSPELDRLSESTKDSIDIRGGANSVLFWFMKVVIDNFVIKVAILGAASASIWVETADKAASQLAKHGPAMLLAPGKRFLRLYHRIKGVRS